MKIKFIVPISVLLFAIHLPNSASAQGSLTPSGAPAPSMKTLAQIEPRTPISSAPFVITNSGSYYLTTNLTVSSGDGIMITANQVTLDLNGFGIYSTAATAAGTGVLLASSRTNITILNGYIVGRVTQSGGVFSGGGFDSGIFLVIDSANTNTFGLPSNVRVSSVTVSGCLSYGIGLGGLGTIVESCIVQTAGISGISAGIVKNSSATDCGSTGIDGEQILDSKAQCVGDGRAISANSIAVNCYGVSESGSGVFCSKVAQNCHGTTSSAFEYGLYADVAQNCYGDNSIGTGLRAFSSAINCTASGGTTGLLADRLAENCNGRANTNGIGLQSYGSAINSYGYCPAGNSGTGLVAGQANNCYGQHDGSGVGLSASVAIGCHGRCSGNNFAISASIVVSCTAYRQTGTPAISFGNKYNMP